MAMKTLLLIALMSSASAVVKLREIFSWNALDWNFPSPYSRQLAMQSGAFIPENALPVGVERWKNKLFVSVPRWKEGIPATLNYIPLDAPYNPSPKLNPYPSFAGNELGNCQSGLNTVYRIKVDKCDRLWVLDTGTYGYGLDEHKNNVHREKPARLMTAICGSHKYLSRGIEGSLTTRLTNQSIHSKHPNVTNLCPYSLNVYDLNTDERIRRYVFRPEDIVPSTFIANIALDEGKTCDDTFAYFSDELGYGLIAYSWEQNRSWRFSHGYFMADPLLGDYNIGGLNFQWSAEGIFGITASPVGIDGYRILYFSPLTSHTQFAVSTRILRDESKVTDSYPDFKIVGVRGNNSHTTSKVMDELTGIEFFNLIDQNAIGCWRQDLPYKSENIGVVDKDDVGLVFPSDIKIDQDRNLWVLSDRMPVFLESTLDYSDINFRIFTADLDLLVQETICEPESQFSQGFNQYTSSNKQIPQNPLTFYNNALGAPVSPESYTVFGTILSPKPGLISSYSPSILKNAIATSQSLINKPEETAIPYLIGRSLKHSSLNNRQPWWYQKGTYKVL